MKFLVVKVDTNDADYVSKVSKISDADLEILKPLLAAIAEFKPYSGVSSSGSEWTHRHNYPFGEILRSDLGEKSPREMYPDISEDVFEAFNDYLPSTEYGFHTIKRVDIIDGTIEQLL